VRFIYRKVGNYAVAEELAQETFVRAYQASATYRAKARYTTWLYRIAVNLVLNHKRWQRARGTQFSIDDHNESRPVMQLPDRTQTIDELLLAVQARGRILGAVKGLPSRQRNAVLLHKYGNMSYDQIADSMGGTLQMVRALMFRAYQNLRRELVQ
jgi:RNA polymerase sigma-70 factor (ECF subfamily)